MSDMERVIGALTEAKHSTHARFDRLEAKVDHIDRRVSGLAAFKWQVIGGMTAIVAVFEILKAFQ
jgi:hypothetical protein